MKRFLSLVMALLMMVALLSVSTAGVAEEKVTLTVAHTYTKEEAEAGDMTRKGPRDAILQFAEENKDKIELEITEIQHNDYETKMQALAAANDLPDVFLVKGSWINNFVENGLIADITEAYQNCSFKDEYRPYLFDPATVNGAIYAAPMQFSSTALVFYNKDLWKEAGYDTLPATWQELIAADAKFDAMGLDTISFGNKDKWQINSSWISAIADRYTGTEWTNSIIAKDGVANFTDPEFVSALNLIAQIGASGMLNPDYSTITHQQAASQFINGKSATFIDGYWAISYLLQNADENFLSKLAIAPHPGVEGGKGDPSSITAGCGWFIAVNSKLEGEKQAEFFTWLYDLEYDKMGLPRPDLVLCLDMPTELAHLLREKRDTQGVGDADIHEHAEQYLARCRETARQAAKHYGWTLISCVKDGRLRSIEDIHEEIYRHIAACLEG